MGVFAKVPAASIPLQRLKQRGADVREKSRRNRGAIARLFAPKDALPAMIAAKAFDLAAAYPRFTISYMNTAAAMAAFSDSAPPRIGRR